MRKIAILSTDKYCIKANPFSNHDHALYFSDRLQSSNFKYPVIQDKDSYYLILIFV